MVFTLSLIHPQTCLSRCDTPVVALTPEWLLIDDWLLISSWLQHDMLFTQSCVLSSSHSSLWCCFICFWPTEGPWQQTSQVNMSAWVDGRVSVCQDYKNMLMRHSESHFCQKKTTDSRKQKIIIFLLFGINKIWQCSSHHALGEATRMCGLHLSPLFMALYLFTFCLISSMRSSSCLLCNHGNRWTAKY